jgi:hypothetical protein
VVDCFRGVKQMITENQNDERTETEEAVLDQATEELARVHTLIGPRFRRAEARHRARGFLPGLTSPVERKNGWKPGGGTGRTWAARRATAAGRSRLGGRGSA